MQISGSTLNVGMTMPNQQVEKVMPQEKTQPVSELTIGEQAVTRANEAITKKITGSRELHFAVHEQTEEIMVKVVDKETQDTIREIPSEKILDMIAKFYELNGLFVDEKR